MWQVERLLAAEQKANDFKPSEDGNPPDHRPTNACTKVTAYLEHMLEAVYGALEGLNKQAFMTELGNRLYKALLVHWQRFTFSARLLASNIFYLFFSLPPYACVVSERSHVNLVLTINSRNLGIGWAPQFMAFHLQVINHLLS
jgi:hypothetical protein